MNRSVPILVGFLLTACGAAVTSGNNSADARQGARRSTTHRPDPNAGLENARARASWDEGGAPGCFDPALRGRERAVAERLGAVPCSVTSQGAAALARGGDSWVGRYAATFDGARGEVIISREPNRLLRVELSMGGNGCAGSALGFVAPPRGSVLNFENQTGNQADGFTSCRIALDRRGNLLRVSESGVCTDLHGMSCGFSGSATRR